MDYTNWNPGEPNNVGGVENCVHMQAGGDKPGTWNDLADSSLLCAVVEVPGNSHPESLTKSERALVGTWYARGMADRPCRIAATQNILFAINENMTTTRAIYTTDGLIFLPNWKVYGEIAGDKILWSDGYWWSRTPVKYGTAQKSDATDK